MPIPADTPLFANNVLTGLAADISGAALTLSVTATDGADMPSPDIYEYFVILVERISDGSKEIMHCVGRTADTLTVDRAQEGTAALAFTAGDRITMPLTAGLLEFLRDT